MMGEVPNEEICVGQLSHSVPILENLFSVTPASLV
jgi:hypothetical protein